MENRRAVVDISEDEIIVNDLDYINEVMTKGDDRWAQSELRLYVDIMNGTLPDDRHREAIRHLYDRACVISGKCKQVDDDDNAHCDEVCAKLLATKYYKSNKFLSDIRKKIAEGIELSKKQYAAVMKLYDEIRILPMYKDL